MRRALPLLAALSGAIAATGALATEAPQDRVEALSREAARIAADLKSGAQEANQVERDLAALTGELAELAEREAAARAELATKRARLRRLLAAFASLSRAPEPAILAHPDAPLAAARAATLLERIGPALIEEARGVEAAVRDIAELRAGRQAAQGRLEDSAAELAALRAELDAALTLKREELNTARAGAAAALEAEALARALKAAENLEKALDRAAAPPPAPRDPFAREAR